MPQLPRSQHRRITVAGNWRAPIPLQQNGIIPRPNPLRRADRRRSCAVPPPAGRACSGGTGEDELNPLFFGGAVFGDNAAALPLQQAAIGLGAVRGSRLGQAFDLDAEGGTGIEDINQRESEHRDDHGEVQQAEPGDKSRQGDNDQPDGVTRRIGGRAKADQPANAEHNNADHRAELTDRHADHCADHGIHDIHMRHVCLMQLVYRAPRRRMIADQGAEHAGQQKSAK